MEGERKQSPQTDTLPLTLTAAAFTDADGWEKPTCPSAYAWINTTCCLHTMGYHVALGRREVLPHAVTWLNHEPAEKAPIGLQGLWGGSRMGNPCWTGTEFLFGDDEKKFWKRTFGMVV